MSECLCKIKAVIKEDEKLIGELSPVKVIPPRIRPVNVIPSKEEQTIRVPESLDGFNPVRVEAVTSSIDSNIQPNNIKEGINILGVEGIFDGVDGETVVINPSTSQQIITPTSPYNAIIEANIQAVTSAIDSNIQAENIKSGVSILGVNGNVVELNGETINVIPSTSSQTILPTNPYNAITQANVNAVDSSIDANIIAGNIKDGVSILGVTGNVIELNGSTETVTPTTSQQIITPTSPSNGFTSVTINAVTSAIDSNIAASNIKSGVSILGVSGNVVELDGETVTITPSVTSQTITPTAPHNAITAATVNAVTSAIDSSIVASNIKSGATILGVVGNVVELNGESVTVNPTTSQQIITPTSPYNAITSATVEAVTSSIDSNIQPENIKNGISILGVVGSYSGSGAVIDTINIVPSVSSQTISATSGVDGYSPITVDAVTSAIDSSIVATNIKSGVSILGVSGSVIELNGESITITPTTSQQVITPTSPYNAITQATVSAVTSSIDSNIVAGNIKSGVTILGVTGSYGGGGGSSISVEKAVNSNGVLISNGANFIDLSGATDISQYVLSNAYRNNTALSGTVDMSSLTQISGAYSCQYMAFYATNITGVDLGSLVTINGSYACQYMFNSCTGITSVDLSSLTTINAEYCCNLMFAGCTGIIGTLDLGSLTNIYGNYSCANAFYGCTNITGLDLGSLKNIGASFYSYVCSNMFQGCSNLASLDLSALEKVEGRESCYQMFKSCGITGALDLSSLKTISGQTACSIMFGSCPNITSVDLSALEIVGGIRGANNMFYDCAGITSADLSHLTFLTFNNGCYGMFGGCSSLANVDLSSLAIADKQAALSVAFRNTALTTLSFPALRANGFGSLTNQFNNMLQGVDGCTVHFPSNLQSVIGSWADVTAGFGGTNITVSFDLPATVTLTGADTISYVRNPKDDTATALAWRVMENGTTIDWTSYFTSGLTDPVVSDTIYSDSACTIAVTTISSIA